MSARATVVEAVQKCQGDKDASEVLSLDFSSCQPQSTDELFKAIADFPNVKTLNLSNIGLKTLTGFPALTMLEELDISQNEFCDDLSGLIPCSKLIKLTMNGCGVKSLESLAPLGKLPNLQMLSLKMSPVGSLDNFNKKCFALLPNLVSIDECSRPGHDSERDDNENGNNYAAENGDNEEEDEDDEEEDDESDEEIGIEALQKSDDLDDEDEEDYNPDEAELDECDDDFDDDEDENDVDEEDNGANLSGAGVTGPRRPASKRRHETDSKDDAGEVSASKVQVTEGVEEGVTNGTAAK